MALPPFVLVGSSAAAARAAFSAAFDALPISWFNSRLDSEQRERLPCAIAMCCKTSTVFSAISRLAVSTFAFAVASCARLASPPSPSLNVRGYSVTERSTPNKRPNPKPPDNRPVGDGIHNTAAAALYTGIQPQTNSRHSDQWCARLLAVQLINESCREASPAICIMFHQHMGLNIALLNSRSLTWVGPGTSSVCVLLPNTAARLASAPDFDFAASTEQNRKLM